MHRSSSSSTKKLVEKKKNTEMRNQWYLLSTLLDQLLGSWGC